MVNALRRTLLRDLKKKERETHLTVEGLCTLRASLLQERLGGLQGVFCFGPCPGAVNPNNCSFDRRPLLRGGLDRARRGRRGSLEPRKKEDETTGEKRGRKGCKKLAPSRGPWSRAHRVRQQAVAVVGSHPSRCSVSAFGWWSRAVRCAVPAQPQLPGRVLCKIMAVVSQTFMKLRRGGAALQFRLGPRLVLSRGAGESHRFMSLA